MKLVLLSDCHLSATNPIGRLDDILETSLRKMEFVLNYAEENKATILQAADFLDTSRSWTLHSKLLALFNKHKRVKIYLIYGQHDMYMRSEESKYATSLGAFIEAGYLDILSDNPIQIGGMDVYGCSYGKEIPKVVSTRNFNVLVIHADIGDKPLYAGHKFTHAEKFLEKNKDYDLILTGDIHQKFLFRIKDRYIINTGPMVRLEATKYNIRHIPCFAVFDSNIDKIKWVEIPHEDYEEVFSRKHIEDKNRNENVLNEFIDKIKNANFQSVDFFSNLEKYLKENKVSKEVVDSIKSIISKE